MLLWGSVKMLVGREDKGMAPFTIPSQSIYSIFWGKCVAFYLRKVKEKKKMLLLKEFENHLDPSALPIPVNSSFVSLPRSTGRPSAPDPLLHFSSVHSVAQLCLTLCDPMDHSTPGLSVHHQLLEFTQTDVH